MFLSYAHEDAPAANLLRHNLINSGVDVFDSSLITPGSNISHAINEGLETAEGVIFLLSQNFVKSEWAQVEVAAASAEIAGGERKLIVPLLIDPNFDTNKIPSLLRRYQWLDARDGSLTDAARSISRSLSGLVGQPDVREQLDSEEFLLNLRRMELDLERRAYEGAQFAEATARRYRMLAIAATASTLMVAVALSLLAILYKDSAEDSRNVIVALGGVLAGASGAVIAQMFLMSRRRRRRGNQP
ncbi:toll/interleukin-1 receptor domain-containing protein [Phycicoccus sp. M110.8]|uniref:toll/interleukin-1 receptor domain-containing protein n=1 Tax=Phycicoccus sp. M110.8 TaxID=3075433 RepID=UPI0028FD0B8E|nr:toll/interleukin-1 receptor domain-containing protein [Phycicoccus sp. M110.8]MDU0315269.1 toll/interleukin-1 receptor domain-containing protein [Phycicoccus sp. M110.8]